MQFKKIGIASDHAGKDLRKMILDFVALMDCEIIDYGVDFDSDKSVDYPDFAALLANDVSKGNIDGAIAICGTGIGMCITANKFPKVRATSVWDDFSCKMSRMHNDSNVMCIGSRSLNHHRAVELVKLWLETPFEGDRHQMRLNKITEIEKSNFVPR